MNTYGTRKWWALAALTLALLVVGLDATVLSVALPTLATALHASEIELQWFVASYSLAMVAMLLPAGLLGDRYGRKKMLFCALALFGIASLGAAYAETSGEFIVARTVLGIGAAFIIPLSLAIIPVLFTEEERPRAVGAWSAANFLALPIGPILGGWLLTHFWWGSVFLINIPVVILALVAVAVLMPESRSAERPGLDPLGILTSSAGLVMVVYGVIEAGQNGWGNTGALALIFAGLLVLVAFILWERRLTSRPGGQPLIDIALFRSASFTWGTILAGVGVFAMFGVLFATPQYFMAILGADAQSIGFRLLPTIGGFVVGAVLAERIGSWAGPKFAVALGFAILAGGLMLGATTSVTSADWFSLVWTGVAGAGMGLALVNAANGALGALSPERSGVGAALMQAINKVGGPLSAAVLGSVLNSIYRDHLNLAELPAQAAEAVQKSVFGGLAVAQQMGSAALLATVQVSFVDALDAALFVSAGVAAAGMVLALVFLPRRASLPAATTDAERQTTAAGSSVVPGDAIASGETEGKGLELGHGSTAGG